MFDKKVSTLPPETLAAFDNDSLRARIFYEKYALRNSENEPVETNPEPDVEATGARISFSRKPGEKRGLGEKLSAGF